MNELVRESQLDLDKSIWIVADMDSLDPITVEAWDAYVEAVALMTETKAAVKALVVETIEASGHDKLFAPKELVVKFSAPFSKAPELGWGYVKAKETSTGKTKRKFSMGALPKRKRG